MARKEANNKQDTTSGKKASTSKKGKEEATKTKSPVVKQSDTDNDASTQDLFKTVLGVQKKDNILITSKYSQDVFFIQINRANLVGFFACGLIHPVNY